MKANRRTFIKGAGAMLAFPTIIPSRVLGDNAPSKQITLGFIGMGGQGIGVNLKMFLREKDARVLAVCDAYKSRAVKAAALVGNDCKIHQDFRKVIDDETIDAVVISAPDHWHVPMSMMALKAGKDVFCEKPTYCIDEGLELVEEVRKREAVFQAGIEDRSLIHYHKMIEWVKNGAIGTLRRVEVTLRNGQDRAKESPVAPPGDLDWNLWLGPAPFHDFTANRTGPQHWRFISDYANGSITDWGAHLVDTAQRGADARGVCPVEVSGVGVIPEGRMSDVPLKYDLNYRYGNGVEMNVKAGGTSIKFEGDKGWIRRQKWGGGLDASDPAILQTKYAPGESRMGPRPPREQRDFLDGVKSRQPTAYTAQALHEISTTLHMGVLSVRLGRTLKYDSGKNNFIKDDEANALRKRPKPRDWEAGS
jgi:predicted dehydrogenase